MTFKNILGHKWYGPERVKESWGVTKYFIKCNRCGLKMQAKYPLPEETLRSLGYEDCNTTIVKRVMLE